MTACTGHVHIACKHVHIKGIPVPDTTRPPTQTLHNSAGSKARVLQEAYAEDVFAFGAMS